MSTRAHAVSDSATMLRRNLRHALRYPSMSVSIVATPVVFLLLFVYVFGGTLGAGLGSTPGGGRYIDYVVPGIVVLTAATASMSTAVSVCVDMTEGIVARFRTMSIFRGALLTGHVAGSMIQTMVSMGLVIGAALLMGFRPTADPARWIAAAGVLAMLSLALTWLAVALGMVANSPEAASSLPLPLMLLPFLGSGFVPASSMSAGVRWFAGNQPFTPIIETLRGLLTGTPIGHNAVLAVTWCAGLTLGGYLWARAAYNRGPVR